MSAEEEERFQSSNSCWICDKLVNVGDDKVRDYCHLELTMKIPVMFHNLRGYDRHLIIKKISKFDVKVSNQMD